MAPAISTATRARWETLLARYPVKRSALIPMLHEVQAEAGYLSPEALADVAAVVGLPPVQVMEVATFYDMFRLEPAGRHEIYFCHNLPCSLRGAEGLLTLLQERLGVREGQTTPDGQFTLRRFECLASCGSGPVMQVDGRYCHHLTREKLDDILARLRRGEALNHEPQPLAPPSAAGGRSERVLTKNYAQPGYGGTLDEYVARGGYEAAAKALTGHTPDQLIDIVKRSGLRGRGGAGFPTGVKWGFVPKDRSRPTYLLCNGDESEPGTFKDRELIERDPHQLLEGMIIAAYAVGAHTAYLYCRGEFVYGAQVLERALAEAYGRGYLGQNLFRTGFNLDIHLHRGAGAYICGEETALIESLEGKRGEPRLRPPFPATSGLYRMPTVVNNVETLSNLPHILRRGPEWYAGIGTAKSTGTRLFSVSGHVERPGNYELPVNVTLRELILEHAGGTPGGRQLKAVIPGGSSAPVLTDRHLDTTMDFESLAAAGSMGGSGAVIVMDDTTCMVRVGEIVTRFYHHESCGQCTPCREGTAWLHKTLRRIEEGKGRPEDLDLLLDICDNMKGRTICVLSDAAAMPIESYLRYFRPEFEQHIREHGCPFRARGL